MSEKAKRGGLQTTPSFGYCAENNILVPVPEEAAIVKEIFSRFVDGEGLYSIAKRLNGLGFRTHRGNRFENRTIDYIIHNPTYIGKLRWNPSGKTNRYDYNNTDRIISQGQHQPIIDMEMWEAAQKRACEIKAKRRPYMRPACEHRLSGLIKCSECGGGMIKAGRYWRCNAYTKGACTVSQNIADMP